MLKQICQWYKITVASKHVPRTTDIFAKADETSETSEEQPLVEEQSVEQALVEDNQLVKMKDEQTLG